MHTSTLTFRFLAVLVCAAALACRAGPARQPSGPPSEPALAAPQGWRHDLPLARLFVPADMASLDSANGTVRVPLYLHFQGGPEVAERNFVRMGQSGVVIGSTLAGFSSAFRRPYEDPAAFRTLLDEGERALSTQLGRTACFDPITITFFSAGYGAVRELLKDPESFERIDCLIAADSIYADVAAPGVRVPRIEQMQDFMRFAQGAARGEKIFVLVNTQIATDYASTAECADLLLASVGGERQRAGWSTEEGTTVDTEIHVGRFHLLGVKAATAESHVACLRMLPELVRRYGVKATAQP